MEHNRGAIVGRTAVGSELGYPVRGVKSMLTFLFRVLDSILQPDFSVFLIDQESLSKESPDMPSGQEPGQPKSR